MILELFFLTFLLLLLGHFLETVQDSPQVLDLPSSGDDNGRTSITDFARAQDLNVFLLSNAVCRSNREQGFHAIPKINVFDLLTSFFRVALSTKIAVIHSDDDQTSRSELENRIRKKVV